MKRYCSAVITVLLCLATLGSVRAQDSIITVRMDGSRVAVLEHAHGMTTVYDGNTRVIGTIDGNGVVRDRNGDALGVVDSRGIIHSYLGDLTATMESDGRMYVHQELVGAVQPNGIIRGFGGRHWGSTQGASGFADMRRVAGYLVFLSGGTYRFWNDKPGSGWTEIP